MGKPLAPLAAAGSQFSCVLVQILPVQKNAAKLLNNISDDEWLDGFGFRPFAKSGAAGGVSWHEASNLLVQHGLRRKRYSLMDNCRGVILYRIQRPGLHGNLIFVKCNYFCLDGEYEWPPKAFVITI